MPVDKCLICKKPVVEKFRPFCSVRCADVDLGRWLGETYTVPVTEVDDEDGEKAISVDSSETPDA